jgi:hypothetical protein
MTCVRTAAREGLGDKWQWQLRSLRCCMVNAFVHLADGNLAARSAKHRAWLAVVHFVHWLGHWGLEELLFAADLTWGLNQISRKGRPG